MHFIWAYIRIGTEWGGEYRPITGAAKYRSNTLHCAGVAPVFVFDGPGFAVRINWGVGVHGLQYPIRRKLILQ